MRQRTVPSRRTIPLLLIWLGLVAMACNLSDSGPPPTVVPRATSTPPPTIGYATLAPEEYPDAATQIAMVPQQPDMALSNLMAQVVPDRLFMHVSTLVNMKTRHVNSSYSTPNEGIGAAARYVQAEFNAIRANSVQQAFSVFTHEFPVEFAGVQSTGQNIIGVLQGYEPGAGVIVLASHYDSINLDFENIAAPAPGANDDASGVGALIEIARILSQKRHRATIMFVCFSAEEVQRQGSIAFVKDYLQGQNIDVTAMINMDIIGSADGPDGSINDKQIRVFSVEPNESRSRQLARSVQLIAERSGAPLEIVTQTTADRAGRYGDHMSFSDAGYPAVRFIEAIEEADRHHTPRDNTEDIDPTYYVKATQTILMVVNALADGPRPPRSLVLRDAGEGLRTLVWERTTDATGYVVALRAPGALDFTPFETIENTVTWDGFVASRFIGVAVAAKDASGVVGPFSIEYSITN
ncbi:MAG: M20/M25/M40 family metallo-hydrolase [Chloroflexi bacterium]|nr:M20/M25/M40 family metallo-hydrolase [Chloroflexota bacterium]